MVSISCTPDHTTKAPSGSQQTNCRHTTQYDLPQTQLSDLLRPANLQTPLNLPDIKGLTLHPLQMTDLPQLLYLEKKIFPSPWTQQQFTLGLQKTLFTVFGLKNASQLVAYAALYCAADEAEILKFAVSPTHRRQKTGTHLLLFLLALCCAHDIKRVHLEVRHSNTAAQQLYTRCGFQPAGTRKKYYCDTGEDALCMTADLTTAPPVQPE